MIRSAMIVIAGVVCVSSCCTMEPSDKVSSFDIVRRKIASIMDEPKISEDRLRTSIKTLEAGVSDIRNVGSSQRASVNQLRESVDNLGLEIDVLHEKIDDFFIFLTER